MLTDHEIAQLMNHHSLQGGNNDSPWWLTFARAVERMAAERSSKSALNNAGTRAVACFPGDCQWCELQD